MDPMHIVALIQGSWCPLSALLVKKMLLEVLLPQLTFFFFYSQNFFSRFLKKRSRCKGGWDVELAMSDSGKVPQVVIKVCEFRSLRRRF